MFFLKIINKYESPNDVYKKIQTYLTEHHDNHTIPQYKFITINDKLLPYITIFHTETLNQDMKDYGFTNFDLHLNVNNEKINYMNYLNRDSINLINKIYNLDFVLFGYDII